MTEAGGLAVGWKNVWAVGTLSRWLREFHVLKGGHATFDTKTHTEVILNVKISTKTVKDGLDNYQQVGDGNLSYQRA